MQRMRDDGGGCCFQLVQKRCNNKQLFEKCLEKYAASIADKRTASTGTSKVGEEKESRVVCVPSLAETDQRLTGWTTSGKVRKGLEEKSSGTTPRQRNLRVATP